MTVRKFMAASMALVSLTAGIDFSFSGCCLPACAATTPKKEVRVKHTATPRPPLVEKYLVEGKLSEGETALLDRLQHHPKDDEARFGLGVLQFLQAVEKLFQDISYYKIRDYDEIKDLVPILSKFRRSSGAAEKITYEKARKIIEDFQARVAKAEATLGGINDEKVKLPLHFGMIRLDLTGDGILSENETLWKLYTVVQNSHKDITPEQAKTFYIKFDRGDVHWLRGYCNVFLALCDMYLAYDSRETFDRTIQLIFSNVDTPYKALMARRGGGKKIKSIDEAIIVDVIAVIHSIRWKLIEPKRMEAALHHLETVIDQSRVSWKFIMAETDDDHEWLPNPRQTGVIPDVKVTEAMVASWAEVMNESERVLSGKLLLPFLCAGEGEGVNLRRVFLEPRDFDLVYWVQGTDALPYIEEGTRTKFETWRTLSREFGGHFPGFAFWFN